MFAFLILPVLTCGFFICNYSLPHFYKLHRYEGQQLYLKSAWLGICCLGVTIILTICLNVWGNPAWDIHAQISEVLSTGLNDAKLVEHMAWVVIIAFLMHLVALLYVCTKNASLKVVSWHSKIDQKVKLMKIVLNDSPLDRALFQSFEKDMDVLLSLTNRKVYVGQVLSMGEPNEKEGMDQEITIMPLMSGFRDKDDLTVTFNTHYKAVTTDVDMTVTIRQELIETVSPFDYDVYKEFLTIQKDREKKTQETGREHTIYVKFLDSDKEPDDGAENP